MTSVYNKGLFLAFLGFFLLCGAVRGQDVEITLGPDEVAENEAWTITVTVKNEAGTDTVTMKNDRLKDYGEFTEIEGFRKRGTSSQSSTSIINGQISSSQSVTMTYLPSGQGQYTVPPFTMTVNGRQVSSPGKTVRVGPPAQVKRSDPFRGFFDSDPFDDFFGREETEFIDIREDAFLAMTTSKDEVYV